MRVVLLAREPSSMAGRAVECNLAEPLMQQFASWNVRIICDYHDLPGFSYTHQ